MMRDVRARFASLALLSIVVAPHGGCATTETATEGAAASLPAGSVDATYDETADVRHLRARLNQARLDAGLEPASPLQGAEAAMKNAKQWIENGIAPQTALDNAFQTGEDGENSVADWAVPVDSPQALAFPDELVKAEHLTLAIAVVRVRARPPQGTRHVVLLVRAGAASSRNEFQ
jgi:hypothetical protein